MDGFDFSQLTDFNRDLLNIAREQYPRETKKFLNKQGGELKKEVVKKAKSLVKKKTGNYLKSLKKGKVYDYQGDMAIRTFSYSPHAHLIENGHVQKDKNGNDLGFVQGKHVFRQAQDDFENTFYNNIQTFLDEMLDKGLS